MNDKAKYIIASLQDAANLLYRSKHDENGDFLLLLALALKEAQADKLYSQIFALAEETA